MKRDSNSRQWKGMYAGQRIAITDDGNVVLPVYDGYNNLGLSAVQVEAIVMAYAWRYGTGTIQNKFNAYMDSVEVNRSVQE